MSDPICSFPLSPQVLRQVAQKIQNASKAGHDEIIATHCQQTGFVLSVHIAAGQPFYFECLGPLTVRQADAWAHGLSDSGTAPRVLM